MIIKVIGGIMSRFFINVCDSTARVPFQATGRGCGVEFLTIFFIYGIMVKKCRMYTKHFLKTPQKSRVFWYIIYIGFNGKVFVKSD